MSGFAALFSGRRIASASLSFALLSGSAHAEKVRVAIPTASPGSAFFILALQKGYYAEEGLEVEAQVAGGGIAVPGLISGDLQFSLSTGASISAILKGAKLKIVMITQDRPGGQVWGIKPEIKSLTDLKGTQVGIQSRGDTGEIAILSLLKAKGLPKDYLGFTPMGTDVNRLAALKSGALPAVQLSWFGIEELGHVSGAHDVIDLFSEVRMPYAGLVTSDAVLANHPDVLTKMIRGSLKGVAYEKAYRDESIKIIAAYGGLSPSQTAFDFDRVLLSAIPDNIGTAEMQENEVALRADLLDIPKDKVMPASAVYNFTALRKANEDLKGWKPPAP